MYGLAKASKLAETYKLIGAVGLAKACKAFEKITGAWGKVDAIISLVILLY